MLDQTKTCPTVTVAANDLRNALAFARMSVEIRSTVPILGMVLIETEASELRITATNMDVEAQATIPAEAVQGRIAITLAPRILAGLLRYADGPVTISCVGDIATITAEDVSAEFRVLCPASEWPWLRFDAQGGGAIELGEEKLRRALGACSVCISTEDVRYYLQGILLESCDGKLRAISTDGHRMAIYDTGEAWAAPDAILPRLAAQIISSRLRRGGNGTVKVKQFAWSELVRARPDEEATRLRIGFEFRGDGWRVRTKTINGMFPDYRRVIPTIPADGAPFSVTLSAAALRRFPDIPHASRCVAINPDAGSMQMDASGEVKVTMPVQGKGGKVGFNLRYLLAFARAGVIKLEGDGNLNAYRVSTDDPALTQVLMSMRC